jgi:hypothetical protein
MRGEGGEALDVALGLLRAPALRRALRDRPLPAGVAEVLALASGSPESARSAAERSGYDKAELVEAARFYVQQVLLADGADAYRMLGAERGADQAVLRDHHRLLLRWLHPDRSGAQWESALATRVNQAWNQLRTASARASYDAALAADPAPAAVPSPPVVPGRGSAVVAASPSVRAQESRSDPATQPRPLSGPIAVGVLGACCIVLAWLAINREDVRDDVRAPAPGATAATVPVPVPPPWVALPLAPEAVPGSAAPGRAEPDRAEPAAGALLPRVPLAAQPEGRALANAAAPARVAGPHVSAVPAGQARVEAMPAPPARRESAVTPSAPLPIQTPPAPSSAPHAPAPVSNAAEPADPLQLFREAEAALRTVTAYLTDTGADPAWLDPATGLEAAGIRAQLRIRHHHIARPLMRIDVPNWTLGTGAASVLGAYRLGDRRGTVETGVLRLDLARLDQEWRVAGLQLEPAR